jgi:hypothetical protein
MVKTSAKYKTQYSELLWYTKKRAKVLLKIDKLTANSYTFS